jgi:hypothetical protein
MTDRKDGSAGASPSQAQNLPQRKHPAHGVLVQTNLPTIVFLTICTKNRAPWLARNQIHEHLRDVWASAAASLVGSFARHSSRVHSTALILSAAFILATIVGCHSEQKQQPASEAFVAFEKRLNQNGAVTFRSWNGKAYRMDSDTELAFFPDDLVEMLEWRLSLVHYTGRYHLDRDGRITASFDDYQPQWPMTQLDLNGEALLLRPVDPDSPVIIGERHPTLLHTESNFWPFRMLTGKDEQQVLKTMNMHPR